MERCICDFDKFWCGGLMCHRPITKAEIMYSKQLTNMDAFKMFIESKGRVQKALKENFISQLKHTTVIMPK